jgi:hypothetical protein
MQRGSSLLTCIICCRPLLVSSASHLTGAIYNDVFSITFRIFPSGYTRLPGSPGMYQLSSRPHVFGLDFQWQDASNELEFRECRRASYICCEVHMSANQLWH